VENGERGHGADCGTEAGDVLRTAIGARDRGGMPPPVRSRAAHIDYVLVVK
jgi:hypothetical protein